MWRWRPRSDNRWQWDSCVFQIQKQVGNTDEGIQTAVFLPSKLGHTQTTAWWKVELQWFILWWLPAALRLQFECLLFWRAGQKCVRRREALWRQHRKNIRRKLLSSRTTFRKLHMDASLSILCKLWFTTGWSNQWRRVASEDSKCVLVRHKRFLRVQIGSSNHTWNVISISCWYERNQRKSQTYY